MRHVGSLIAGMLIAPIAWLLIALGQQKSTETVAKWVERGAFDSADLTRSKVSIAVDTNSIDTRVPKLDGEWELQPINGGTATRARYTVQIDFGGSVPRSMVRSGAVKDLPAMFQRFRDELRARHGRR